MIEILPGILATTKEQFNEMVEKIQPFVSMIHVDTADGVFTKTKCVGPEVVGGVPADVEIDLHMMVEKPENVLSRWLALPQVKRITFHIEATDKIQEIIDTIHGTGKEAGIALNPETPIEAIEPFVSMVDCVQFMSVHPGEYGADFQPEVLNKMAEFHQKFPQIKIAIDGGVNPERMLGMIASGASVFISGGYVMNSDDPRQALSELEKFST